MILAGHRQTDAGVRAREGVQAMTQHDRAETARNRRATPGSRPTIPRAQQHRVGSDLGRLQGLDNWLADVAQAAAADAKAPSELLGEYLVILADAALTGRRPEQRELTAVRRLGRRAAEHGVDANQAVDLYLSAAWRLWRKIPAILPAPREREKVRAAADAVLRVINDAVQVLVEGHQDARRQMIRQEESARREFVDDLLRGDADVSRLVERAEPFGLDLGRSHQVVLAAPATSATVLPRTAVVMERIIVDHFGDREVLVATKDDLLVMLVPGDLRDLRSGVYGLRPGWLSARPVEPTRQERPLAGGSRPALSRARTASRGPTRRRGRLCCWPAGCTETKASSRSATCWSTGSWAATRPPWSTWYTPCWNRSPVPAAAPTPFWRLWTPSSRLEASPPKRRVGFTSRSAPLPTGSPASTRSPATTPPTPPNGWPCTWPSSERAFSAGPPPSCPVSRCRNSDVQARFGVCQGP